MACTYLEIVSYAFKVIFLNRDSQIHFLDAVLLQALSYFHHIFTVILKKKHDEEKHSSYLYFS
jgi:hypothetical protein